MLLPVNEDGERDARQEKDTLVTPDVTLENMKNRLTGGRGVDWDALTAKPNTYLLLDMRNPKKDVRTIHLTAELVDKETGEVRPGLIAAAGEGESVDRTKMRSEAALSLNGHKMQTAVVPLYVDPFSIAEGDYALRLSLFDGETERVTELPLTVVKKRSMGFATLGFALLSLLLVAASIGGLKRCILSIGAKGDITVSLFAAMAFGGVVVPVTLLGDFLHVLLGPFSGLVTGLLSGVVQYLLLVSLLVLFRRPGVCALFFLMRWMLSAVLFGRVTPVGILIAAVSIVILEAALYLAGFYRKKELTPLYAMGISFLIGLCDAGITFVNMEQLMFFYRLYYADWFIGLYMLMNGLLYSTLGSWMGVSHRQPLEAGDGGHDTGDQGSFVPLRIAQEGYAFACGSITGQERDGSHRRAVRLREIDAHQEYHGSFGTGGSTAHGDDLSRWTGRDKDERGRYRASGRHGVSDAR